MFYELALQRRPPLKKATLMGTYLPNPKDSTSTDRDGEVQSIPHRACCWRKGCLRAFFAFHTTGTSISDCVGEKHPWKSLSPPSPSSYRGEKCLHVRRQRNEGTCPHIQSYTASDLDPQTPGSQSAAYSDKQARKERTRGRGDSSWLCGSSRKPKFISQHPY